MGMIEIEQQELAELIGEGGYLFTDPAARSTFAHAASFVLGARDTRFDRDAFLAVALNRQPVTT
jgi:hypothetical protein